MWLTLIIKFLTASVIHASVYQQLVEIFDDLRKDLRKNSRKKAVPLAIKNSESF